MDLKPKFINSVNQFSSNTFKENKKNNIILDEIHEEPQHLPPPPTRIDLTQSTKGLSQPKSMTEAPLRKR